MSVAREADTSASLLLRIRDCRDEGAWATFVAVYAPLVRRYCIRKGLQDADAADVTQEVFVRVAKAIRAFEYAPELGRFRSWVGTITANEIATYLVRAGRQMKEALSFDPPEPDPHWNQDFTNHILAVAMDRIRGEFEPETWNAFEAAWLRQEPPSQIAARLGTAIHTIYVNKSRVLKRLEAEVLKLADDIPLSPG